MTPEEKAIALQARRDQLEVKKIALRAHPDWVVEEWCREAVKRCRRRAKEMGLPFDLTFEGLLALAHPTCPVFGVKLLYERSRLQARADTASVDRIRCELGYVLGNVGIISMRANALKNNVALDELRAIMAWAEQSLPAYRPQPVAKIVRPIQPQLALVVGLRSAAA